MACTRANKGGGDIEQLSPHRNLVSLAVRRHGSVVTLERALGTISNRSIHQKLNHASACISLSNASYIMPSNIIEALCKIIIFLNQKEKKVNNLAARNAYEAATFTIHLRNVVKQAFYSPY